jgi:hypothetical protein
VLIFKGYFLIFNKKQRRRRMGKWAAKICIPCERIVKKRHQKRCPVCGGKIVSLSQELIEQICKIREEKEKRKEKKKKKNNQLAAGEIW